MLKKLSSFLIFSMISIYAFSQSLTPEGKETKIIFTNMGKKSAEIFLVENTSITDSNFTIQTKNGNTSGSSSGDSLSIKFLCETPAEFTLDRGQLKLQIGDGKQRNGMFGTEREPTATFTVKADGSTQYWGIKHVDYVPYKLGTGIAVTGAFTTTAGIVALIITLVSPDIPKEGYIVGGVLSGGGLAVGVAGALIISKAAPRATLLRVEF